MGLEMTTLAALSLRAVELGDRDLATSFCAAMEGDDDRHQAELEIALALGSFSDVERLVRPDLDDEEASGMLEMVGKALKREEDAARFAEFVRGAARASNRLSAWAAVFPSLSPEARERLSAAVADTVKEALRERPEESDDTLCQHVPLDVGREPVRRVARARLTRRSDAPPSPRSRLSSRTIDVMTTARAWTRSPASGR